MNEAWAHVDMDDRVEISEEYRQVLESVRNATSVEDVILDVLPQNSLLNDASIDFFQFIAEENFSFIFQPACYTAYYRYIKPCYSRQDLQIIGGNRSGHWSCVYYDGSKLMIYDSICPAEYNFLHMETKRYIQWRYPNLTEDDILVQPVTRQPDIYSCGVYAIAFATAIALRDDPSQQKFSRDTENMRSHLITILRTRHLLPFPEQL